MYFHAKLFREATLIPVYEGVPILKCWQAQPLAGEALQVGDVGRG